MAVGKGKGMITEFPSIVFRLRSKGNAPDILIFRRHNNKVFLAIVESDLPDAVTSQIAGAVLDYVVRKHGDNKSTISWTNMEKYRRI